VTTGSEVVTLSNAFTVTPGTPVLTLVDPTSARQADSLTVTIQGRFTDFVQGTTQVSLGDGVTVNNVNVSSPTLLAAQIAVSPEAAIVPRQVIVTSAAQVVTLNNAFTVNPRTPLITVSPNSGQQGQSVTLAVTGQFTHFAQGTTQVSLGGYPVSNITIIDATSLTAQLTIPPSAPVGPRTLIVTTGSEVAMHIDAFSVTPGIPVLTTINPTTGKQGETITIGITGQFTHFAQGATQLDFGPGVAVIVAVASPTALMAQLSIADNAAVGARTLTVTTGTEAVTVQNAFSVTPATPVVTTVNPYSGKQGETLIVALTGLYTHFSQAGTAVDFGAGVVVDLVTVTDSRNLLVRLIIAESAPVGLRNVTVATGPEVATLNNGFAVSAGTPVLTTTAPAAGWQGQSLSVVITGKFTHFLPGITQVGLGPGITVENVAVANATSLTAQLSIAADAPVGPRTLAVMTGAEGVILNGAFSIAPVTVTP
jgi:hypothetical protein